MNNEPVAWIAYDEFGDFMLEATPEGDYPWIPLYTHPHSDKSVKAKTLTDEEILQEAENMFGTHFFECIDDPYWIEFARAILRKAQEK